MKQKLALACTLVHEPKILILDEPTTGVDPVSRREFWKLLSEFLSRGLTIVMSTPYLDEAERCARVALLHDGRLLAVDRPERLAINARRPVARGHRRRRSSADRAPDARLPGVGDVQPFGDRAHVRVTAALASASVAAIQDALARAGIERRSACDRSPRRSRTCSSI